MNWSHFLFSFEGRINRGKYWLAAVLYTGVWIAFGIVALVMLGSRMDDLLSFAGTGIFLWLVGAILFIVTFWSGIAVGVKRLHDREKSGWWILVFYFLPSVLSGLQASMAATFMLNLASFVIAIWSLVELGFLRGTRGANQYGPDPLGGFSNEPLR